MSILEKVKNHKLASLLVFIGAVAGGFAAFTAASKDIASFIVCLPQNIGFKIEYAGEATLKIIKRNHEWKKISTIERMMSTGNHHCSNNCRGEPTRTNYKMQVNLSDYKEPTIGDRQLRGAKLECLSGPCGGWNKVYYAKTTENMQSAIASFDVWSKPTTWKLTAEVYEYRPVSEEITETPLRVTTNGNVLLSVPSDAYSAIVNGTMEDDEVFAFDVGQPDKSGIFELLSKRESIDGNEYIYKILRPKCDL